ncbi:MAG: hypothetical protein A2283_15245 [Lentisphaerae bacterium RIFOXYA12_FULL_48_11]|nr:MAG: hypothetical protein A2283_15245 [Lentisphaerae bacterium RIFOXYA12_FULL_48_11]
MFGKNKKRKEDDTYIWEDTQNTKVVRAHGGLNISAAFAFYLVAKKKIKVFLLDGRKKTKPEANNALFRMELPVPLED